MIWVSRFGILTGIRTVCGILGEGYIQMFTVSSISLQPALSLLGYEPSSEQSLAAEYYAARDAGDGAGDA
jgi:hypothetical protein